MRQEPGKEKHFPFVSEFPFLRPHEDQPLRLRLLESVRNLVDTICAFMVSVRVEFRMSDRLPTAIAPMIFEIIEVFALTMSVFVLIHAWLDVNMSARILIVSYVFIEIAKCKT